MNEWTRSSQEHASATPPDIASIGISVHDPQWTSNHWNSLHSVIASPMYLEN